MYRFPIPDWYFWRKVRANYVILKNPKIVHDIGMHFIDIRFISLSVVATHIEGAPKGRKENIQVKWKEVVSNMLLYQSVAKRV